MLKTDLKVLRRQKSPVCVDWHNESCKISVFPKATYQFKATLIENPSMFFTESGKIILECIQKPQRYQTAKTVLHRKNNAKDITKTGPKLF